MEETETTKDSRLACEFVAALPIELSREEQIQLLQDFIKEQFVADGMCADAAIHDPYPPGHNPHEARLAIRPNKEQEAESRAQQVYGEKYSPLLMFDSKKTVSRMLN